MDKQAYAVIMAGGKGERFWPLSTSRRPKQVLSLVGGKPLMQLAIERLHGLIPPERVIVITNADIVEVTCAAAPELPVANVIGEPFGRDTAAAVALASAVVRARDPDAVFCILTADHVIDDNELFLATLRESIQLAAANDVLVTIGIEPTSPSTAFGYIEAGPGLGHPGETGFFQAKRFVEKPDVGTATEYVRSGTFCWNSGMFIWSVNAIRKSLSKFQPQLLRLADAMEPHVGMPDFAARLAEEYGKLDRISIDYAVMEKADNIVMARGTFGWGDVGSWDSLQNYFEKDVSGNVLVGDAAVLDSGRNIVVSEAGTTCLIGVEDMIVVQAAGATLVCHRSRAQDVKRMVHVLREMGGHEEVL